MVLKANYVDGDVYDAAAVNAVAAAVNALSGGGGGGGATDIHGATQKATPADSDEFGLVDSAASWGLKKWTWANLKAALKAYYDGVTSALTYKDLTSPTNTFPTFNQDTTGGAAKLLSARTVRTNLASGSTASFDGTANITPGVTGTLPVANGGTGAATLTGLVKGTGTTAMVAAVAGTDYVAPGGALGTPTSGTLTNCTGLPVAGVSAAGTPSNANFLRGDGQWATPAGSGDVNSNTATSVDSEIVLFNGTSGKSVKRMTVTGLLKAASGVVSAAVAGTDFVAPGGALGTPSSGTLSNCTGLPVTGVNASGTPSASTFLRGDGSWQAAGGGGTGDASTNTSTSVDSEVAVFSGTGGKTLKRASATGLAKLTSGVLSAAVAGTDYVAPAGNVATATKLATTRAIQTDLSSTAAANFDGSANNTHGVTGTLAITNGGTGGATASAARTSLGLGTAAVIDTIAENNMVTNSTTKVPTQASVKAYVDSQARGTVAVTNTISWTIDCDSYDYASNTGLTGAVTINNPTGTPSEGQLLWICVQGTASRAISFGNAFESSTMTLPTTTSSTAPLDMGFKWRSDTSKWRLVALA